MKFLFLIQNNVHSRWTYCFLSQTPFVLIDCEGNAELANHLSSLSRGDNCRNSKSLVSFPCSCFVTMWPKAQKSLCSDWLDISHSGLNGDHLSYLNNSICWLCMRLVWGCRRCGARQTHRTLEWTFLNVCFLRPLILVFMLAFSCGASEKYVFLSDRSLIWVTIDHYQCSTEEWKYICSRLTIICENWATNMVICPH